MSVVASPSHPSRDFYAFEPLFAVHFNGKVYAVFGSANQALRYVRGMDDADRQIFHIENEKGERVEVRDQPRRPGHAYTILETLSRAEGA